MQDELQVIFERQREALTYIADGRDIDVFSEVSRVFAPEMGLVAVRWEVAAAQDEWHQIFSWQAEHSDAQASQSTEHISSFDDQGRRERIVMLCIEPDSSDTRAMLEATAATLRLAIELHDEFRTRIADARSDGDGLGNAFVDSEGYVLRADARFEQLMHSVQPDWSGQIMPMPIDVSATALRRGITWKGLFFYVDPDGTQIHLRARPDRRLPDLSPKELEVARQIASGMTFKEVARELGMAPSTASTHLYKVYDKLQISRRSELVEWLKEHGEALRRD